VESVLRQFEEAKAEEVVKPLSVIGDPARIENMSGIEPVGHAVLLLPYKPDLDSSPLYIPETASRRLDMIEMRGIVVAIGPDAWKRAWWQKLLGIGSTPRAKIGDKVLVSAYCGSVMRGPFDDVQYRLVNAGDVYARIVKERDNA